MKFLFKLQFNGFDIILLAIIELFIIKSWYFQAFMLFIIGGFISTYGTFILIEQQKEKESSRQTTK